MATIRIFYGTVMGTAQGVAIALNKFLSDEGHQTIMQSSAFQASDLENENEILLICTSNTGAGDIPPSLQPLYLHLKNDYPRIAGRSYSIINLGDSAYPTFGQAGISLDEAFTDIGATRLGDILTLDASIGESPQQQALTWAEEWIKNL
ncbi:flavodoxin domain-containing protein [Marinibactrum halimedae]|uniref:Sulfite reductase n=1 Tax=Marinibactrum halimedae TaxID=1444977 RepID=A0AA37WNM1_9GAMM|nr:flavodoxin domain-containing protein [Marinibactrum halimedae]MCD9458009.1 flavodoxin domain-containing protein [Marinibactrum halimedae]GLS27635.1 sulfite reductase [Marinibactrum halimedae]